MIKGIPLGNSKPDGYVGINSLLEGEETKKSWMPVSIFWSCCQHRKDKRRGWKIHRHPIPIYQILNRERVKWQRKLLPCINDGYIYDLQLTSNIIQYFGKNMALVLDQKMQLEEALAALDDYCRNGSEEVDYDQSIVGSEPGDPIYENYNTRREETTLGNPHYRCCKGIQRGRYCGLSMEAESVPAYIKGTFWGGAECGARIPIR